MGKRNCGSQESAVVLHYF